ncbi:MAG: GAF domain-containing protein [Jatrophihabitans sp.]
MTDPTQSDPDTGGAEAAPASQVLTPVQTAADDTDLSSAVSELTAIVAGSLSLEELLTRVASAAVLAIPGADVAGATLLQAGKVEHVVQSLGASAELASQIDAIQYEMVDEGPCITAALEAGPVWSGSLGGDRRWPRFGPRAGRLGVHSVLSLPLILAGDTVIGALNVYSRAKDAFDEHAVQLGQLFAAPAAAAVHNAQVLAQAQTQAAHLQAALGSRAVIDQAIGILRSRTGATAEEAFARLRRISQSENVKLVTVAQHTVDEAVRRARARKANTE